MREIGAILGCDASPVPRALRDEENAEARDQRYAVAQDVFGDAAVFSLLMVDDDGVAIAGDAVDHAPPMRADLRAMIARDDVGGDAVAGANGFPIDVCSAHIANSALLDGSTEGAMKSGFLYVLTHPSDPNLYKVGQTTRHPDERLVEHNSDYAKLAGRIVKKTGQKWELKTFFAVPDVNWAEIVFWSATGLADLPYREGIEIERMDWKLVEVALKAAEKAGVRPVQKVPDYVYANTVWVKKRLEGRGITLIGQVKSKRSGRNNFQCNNGHEWRTKPSYVAEGEGCPHCGMGERTLEEIRQAVVSGVLCLLTHPDKPGLVKIALTYGTLKQSWAENVWGDWEVHRYRNVEEPALAESLIWEMLGFPLPHDREPISTDLHVAEQAFREIHSRLDSLIALAEKG